MKTRAGWCVAKARRRRGGGQEQDAFSVPKSVRDKILARSAVSTSGNDFTPGSYWARSRMVFIGVAGHKGGRLHDSYTRKKPKRKMWPAGELAGHGGFNRS